MAEVESSVTVALQPLQCEAITLTLPMTPDRRLAPNRNNGRMRWTTGEWIKAERHKAKELTFDAHYRSLELRADDVPITDPVTVNMTIHWGKQIGTDGRMRQARRLDWDSATALVKPMIDGALVDTGILADDRQIVAGTVRQEVDKSGEGFTVIVIERAA